MAWDIDPKTGKFTYVKKQRKPGGRYGIKRRGGYTSIAAPGRTFDSNWEQRLFTEYLMIRQAAGEIKNLRHHPKRVYLTDARIGWDVDYSWELPDGTPEWGEGKGFVTPDYLLKKRLWPYYGPGNLYVYTMPGTRAGKGELVTFGSLTFHVETIRLKTSGGSLGYAAGR